MLSQAILSTFSYHSHFSYPLTFDELHRFLVINYPVSSNEVKRMLDELVRKQKVIKHNSYYFLPSSFFLLPSSFDIRLRRAAASRPKLRLARRAAKLISFIPFVQLVCLTGALAMENSGPDDDIDLMIVTSKNRLWLTRPLVVLLISIFFKRRRPNHSEFSIQNSEFKNAICLNLWLDETALEMERCRQTSSTAHELAQMKPLVNKNHTYEKMLQQNLWAKNFLANFWRGVSLPSGESLQSGEESPGSARKLLIILNLFLFRIQYLYMKPKITSEEVSLHAAFFHPLQKSQLKSAEIG